MEIHPILKSAIAIGTATGAGYGFMTQGENLETQGAPTSQQIFESLATGTKDGFTGAGVGLATGGTALALAKILRK